MRTGVEFWRRDSAVPEHIADAIVIAYSEALIKKAVENPHHRVHEVSERIREFRGALLMPTSARRHRLLEFLRLIGLYRPTPPRINYHALEPDGVYGAVVTTQRKL